MANLGIRKIMRRSQWIVGFALMAVVGLALGWLHSHFSKRNSYYQGPITDHFDGTHFHPNWDAPTKREKSFWRWQWEREPAPWPKHVPVHTARPTNRVDDGTALEVTFVGHASVLVQTQGVNLLTDPVWSDHIGPLPFVGSRRASAPGIAWDDLPPIDAVLISHNHYDHLDIPTLQRLVARDHPLIVVPLGNARTITDAIPAAKVIELDWHQSTTLPNTAMAFTLVPVQHWSARWTWDRNHALWGGFVMKTPEQSLFFAGDTGYHAGVFQEIGRRYGPFRLALLPIGAYEPRWFMKAAHVNPDEAVQIFADVRAEHALAIHFGAFQLTDEAREAPAEALRAALQRQRMDSTRFVALDEGKQWRVP